MQDNLTTMAPVSALATEDRASFIWKCYAHVVGAILALVAIETYLFSSGAAAPIANAMMQSPMIVRSRSRVIIRNLSYALVVNDQYSH